LKKGGSNKPKVRSFCSLAITSWIAACLRTTLLPTRPRTDAAHRPVNFPNYEELRNFAETARNLVDDAREALARHVTEHGW